MLTDQHTQSPPDDPPPLSRRDHRIPAAGDNAHTCDCGGCLEFRAIHARFSLELPRHERAAKRDADRVQQRRVEEYTAEHSQPMRRAV